MPYIHVVPYCTKTESFFEGENCGFDLNGVSIHVYLYVCIVNNLAYCPSIMPHSSEFVCNLMHI